MIFLRVLDTMTHDPVNCLFFDPIIEYINRRGEMMDQKSIRQCKADQARILEQFNSPYYSILV